MDKGTVAQRSLHFNFNINEHRAMTVSSKIYVRVNSSFWERDIPLRCDGLRMFVWNNGYESENERNHMKKYRSCKGGPIRQLGGIIQAPSIAPRSCTYEDYKTGLDFGGLGFRLWVWEFSFLLKLEVIVIGIYGNISRTQGMQGAIKLMVTVERKE